jgi:hypothetical protein
MARKLAIAVPVVCGVAGFAILATHSSNAVTALGGALLGVALLAAIAVIMLALGPQSQPDRAREARAREAFESTGRWPDEE